MQFELISSTIFFLYILHMNVKYDLKKFCRNITLSWIWYNCNVIYFIYGTNVIFTVIVLFIVIQNE